MSDPAPFHFHVDHPAAWRPTEAKFEIRGWFYAGQGQRCLDLRARVDKRPYLGIHGLERPDIRDHFHDNEALRSGFSIKVEVWRGARSLALEWHDGTQWREFFRTPLYTSALPAETRKSAPALRTELVFETLHYLYRHFHRASWFTLWRETKHVLNEVLTPVSDVTVGDNFLGQIENPGRWVNVNYEKFRVTGWLFGIGHQVSRLAATTNVLAENRLIYPKDRPDVAAHRPDHSNALKSGFYGLVDIRKDSPSPANLLVYAETPDGRRSLAFARRLYLDRRDEHSGPVPIFKARYFRRLVSVLRLASYLGRYRFEDKAAANEEIERLRKHLSANLGTGEEKKIPQVIVRRRDQDPYTRWCWHNRLTPRLRNVLKQDADKVIAAGGPLISVVVPAYNTPEKYLRELLDCLKEQIYPRWELCIADDNSPQPHVRRILEEAAASDSRIKPVFRTENGHISRATNSALDVATGEFVALLDHDDLLPHDALLHVAEAIVRHPTAGYLYTDEDKIDDNGRHFDPQFKSDWSPEMAITHNYTHHLTVIRRDIIEKAGRLRPEFNGAQDIDLFLRCFELIEDRDVIHVPFIGYHWRAHAESTATRGDQKSYLFDAARNGIAQAISRRGLRAEPILPDIAKHNALCLHQLKWDPAILRENPVTIVIPTKNRLDLLKPCLESIARTTPRESVKVVIVNDNSDDEETISFLATQPARMDLRVEVIHAPPSAEGFNYSRLVNLGTARANTPLVLHLNNDVTALQPGWLEDMVGWLSIPGVGIVGAKLIYPDGTLNHAGISVSHEDGLAHVLFEREPQDDFGYLFLPHAARNVVAVTGACLLTRTALYRELGGFDEEKLQVAYNDVDFCLRAAASGYRCVYTPQAVLQHIGSATRGTSYAEREHLEYIARHGTFKDPYHSETLSFPPHNLPLNPYHRRHAETPRPFRAVVVTQNLKFEGAPIFIFELSRYLISQPGVQITVASTEDGPLRSRFEEAGIKVEIWGVAAITRASTPEAFEAAIETFAKSRQWEDAELFICNTLPTFWAVHLAQYLDKTSAFYIHESRSVAKFFEPSLSVPMLPLAEAALQLATRVIFTASSTREIHEEHNLNDNFRTLPSWVDFDRIDAFCATSDRTALRRKHGLDPDAVIVANIGSACERKGQHIYIRAIDLLNKELAALYPGKKIQWIMVGAREGLYMETLREDIQLMDLGDFIIFEETPLIYDFYRLSDILVCTSFEESFPRVLLEAMVFGNRIVSTDVNGIPEMLTNTDEAYLVGAGDQHKLAAALKRALADHFSSNQKMLSMARARAARHYHHARVFPQHLQMIREAWLG